MNFPKRETEFSSASTSTQPAHSTKKLSDEDIEFLKNLSASTDRDYEQQGGGKTSDGSSVMWKRFKQKLRERPLIAIGT